LITILIGVEFPTCYSNRIIVEIEGLPVNFIDLENQKKNKLATGRTQDRADLENLD